VLLLEANFLFLYSVYLVSCYNCCQLLSFIILLRQTLRDISRLGLCVDVGVDSLHARSGYLSYCNIQMCYLLLLM